MLQVENPAPLKGQLLYTHHVSSNIAQEKNDEKNILSLSASVRDFLLMKTNLNAPHTHICISMYGEKLTHLII